MTILRFSLEFAVRFLVRVPTHVIHDEKVQKPIVVHVNPRGSYRPQGTVLLVGLRESCFFSDIRERPVPVIVVKGVSMYSGQENVLMAVIVIISDGHADIVASAR